MSPLTASPSSSASLSAPPTSAVGATAPANQPVSATAPGGPPGASPPAAAGSFTDVLNSARTAPAEGQTRKAGGQSPAALDAAIAALLAGGSVVVTTVASHGAPGAPGAVGPAPAAGSSTAGAAPAVVPAAASASSSGAGAPPAADAPIGAPTAARHGESPSSALVGGPGAAMTGTPGVAQQPAASSPAPIARALTNATAPGSLAPGSQGSDPTPAHVVRSDSAPSAAPSAAGSDATAAAGAPPATLTRQPATEPTEVTTTAGAIAAASPSGPPRPHHTQGTTGAEVGGINGVNVTAAAAATKDTSGHAKDHAHDGSGGADTNVAQTIADAGSSTTAPATTAAALSAVPLARAAETVHATITTLTTQGLGQARITLSPDALGGLKVVLTQTDHGLVARIIADHPEAAQALAQGAEALRRSLEAAGTPLARLDIGTGSQQTAGFSSGGSQDGAARDANQGTAGSRGPASYGISDSTDEAPSQSTQLTVTLGDGSLVNVLA